MHPEPHTPPTRLSLHALRHLCLVLLTAMLWAPAAAQQNALPSEADSLHQLLESGSLDDTSAVLTRINMAYILLRTDPRRALAEATTAYEQAQAIGFKRGEGRALMNMGSAALSLGDLEAAKQHYTAAETVLRKLENQLDLAAVINNLGHISYYLGKYEDAITYYTRSLEIKQSLQDSAGMAGSYNNLGAAAKRLHDYPNALAYFLKSLQLYQKQGKELQIAGCYSNIATIYQSIGQNERALGYLRDALAILQRLGDLQGQAEAHHNLGTIYQGLEQYIQALDAYNNSLAIAQRLGSSQMLGKLYRNTGYVYMKQGRYPLAEERLQQALSLYEQQPDNSNLTGIYIDLAELYLKLGAKDRAKAYLDKAGQALQDAESPSVMFRFHELLADWYAQTGDYRRAYSIQQATRGLRDTLDKTRTQQQIEGLQSTYALAQKETELERLRQEQEIDRLSNASYNQLLYLIIGFLGFILFGGFAWLRIRQQRSSRVRLEAISAASPVPLMVLRLRDGKILYANPSMGELLGRPIKELYELSAFDFDGSIRESEIARRIMLKNKGRLRDYEIHYDDKQGVSFEALMNIEPLELAGEKAIMLGLYDISKQKQAQKQLEERNDELKHANKELQNAQQQLALSEKLALLGQLMAGVAHEINTPLSAIKSATSHLTQHFSQTQSAMAHAFVHLPVSKARLLDSFLHALEQQRKTLTSREERKHRMRLEQELNGKMEASEAEHVARLLVEVGYTGSLQGYESLFTGEHAGEVNDIVKRCGQLLMSLENTTIAAEKTAHIVMALKRYTHGSLEQKDLPEPIDLVENLNTIVVLYNHQIRQAAELSTDFSGRPVVLANGNKLSQVWTNLVTNAVQALDNVEKAHLRISLNSYNGMAIVKVMDNGKGIPEDIQTRIFEPFFTTKPAGVGTGIGLHLCKDIVEGYGGEISVTSKPGQTVFTVSLPLIDQVEYNANGRSDILVEPRTGKKENLLTD